MDAARTSLRELSELGIDIPAHISAPIIEAIKLGDLTNASPELQAQFWTAYGALNSKIKSPEEAKRYYRRFFYGILSALLLLQLYYSSFMTVQKGLLDVGSKIAAAEVTSAAPGKPDAKKVDLDQKLATYLNATEYLIGIPRKVGGLLTVIGLGDGGQQTNRPDIVAQVELDLATTFVGGFLLPLLYGMLGAIAYVLRRLSDETSGEARTLKRRYSLRVPIGALSGLAAGWLLQPATGSVSASLSPFALAFVAGYSADLVFAAMDRIVAAFSAPPSAPAQPAQPAPAPNPQGQPDPPTQPDPQPHQADPPARPDTPPQPDAPLQPDPPQMRPADQADAQPEPHRDTCDVPPAGEEQKPTQGGGQEQVQLPSDMPMPSSRAQANL